MQFNTRTRQYQHKINLSYNYVAPVSRSYQVCCHLLALISRQLSSGAILASELAQPN